MTMSPHDSLTMDRVTVCTVALITAVYSEQIVIIQPQVAPIKIIEKTQAKISCTVKDGQDSSTWRYKWSIGKQIIGRKSRILLTADRHRFDDGNLTCTVRNSSNVEYGNATVAVIVQYPPKAFSQRRHRVFRGKDVSICQGISGNPPPGIFKWKKVDVTSQWITSDCRLRQVNQSHSGDYLFVMKNTMFDSIRKEERNGTGVQLVRLLVSYGAQVMCPSNYTAVENTTAVLECHVDAYPRAVITWSREGSHEALPQTGSSLRIPHAQLSDRGNYTCTASNTIKHYSGRTYKKEDSCIIHVIVKDREKSEEIWLADTSSPSCSPVCQTYIVGGSLGFIVLALMGLVLLMLVRQHNLSAEKKSTEGDMVEDCTNQYYLHCVPRDQKNRSLSTCDNSCSRAEYPAVNVSRSDTHCQPHDTVDEHGDEPHYIEVETLMEAHDYEIV